MAFFIRDRVQETSTTAGTATFTLAGAPSGFRTFASSGMGNGDTTYYAAVSSAGWEVGIGTTNAGATQLARTTILANSLGTLVAVDLGDATVTKYIFMDIPAAKAVILDFNNTIPSPVFSGTISGTPTVSSASSLASQVVSVTLGTAGNEYSIAVGGGSWASNVITLTHSAVSGPFPTPIPVGSTITVTNTTPAGYGITAGTVTASTATSVSFAQTVNPGAFVNGGTITAYTLQPVWSQSLSTTISSTLWAMASASGGTITAVPNGASAAMFSGGITVLGDEYEMDNMIVSAQLGTASPNINLTVTGSPGPIAGIRQIALRLY